MAFLLLAVATVFVGEVLRYRIVKALVGEKRGLDFGLKYSAEIRRLRREKPRSDIAKRMVLIDRVSLFAYTAGAAMMLLWQFKTDSMKVQR